jgi:NAD(P)H dehydrogenase (quinone)
MIVVTGATGKLGNLVMDALLKKRPASELAVVIRNAGKASQLAGRGVQVRHADYDRPETLASAFGAGEKVLLISANEVGKRAMQHGAVIDAARRAGAGLLAYTSLLRADTSTLHLAEEHRATEQAIRASGLPYVLLRNSWYIENYTEQLPGILQRGALAGAAGQGRFSAATRQDYAEAAVAVLTSDRDAKVTYELAGDHAFTLDEFVSEVSRETGKKIAYANFAPEEYKKVLLEAGLPEPVAEVMVDADVGASQGALYSSSDDLRRLIGRPTTTLRDAIAAALEGTHRLEEAARADAKR